jgi:hypothetical protein
VSGEVSEPETSGQHDRAKGAQLGAPRDDRRSYHRNSVAVDRPIKALDGRGQSGGQGDRFEFRLCLWKVGKGRRLDLQAHPYKDYDQRNHSDECQQYLKHDS